MGVLKIFARFADLLGPAMMLLGAALVSGAMALAGA